MKRNTCFYSKNIFIPIILTFVLIFLSNLLNAQELNWKSTEGPMGGIVGGMDIDSSGNIFAGVYSFMIPYSGLYKSIDNGNHWSELKSQFGDFHVYTVFISKENNIWIGTDNWGGIPDRIYRSTDDGLTWESKSNGYYSGECWAIGESNEGTLFAGDGESGKLYRSTDNGDNWTFSTNLAPLAFAVDSNNIVYAGTFEGLYYSTNDGITWIENNYLTNITVSSVIIDKENSIYCGTGYDNNGCGVYYSNNEGQDWQYLGLTGKVVLSLAINSRGDLYAGTLSDGLFMTSDMGQDWTQYQKGIYEKEVYRLKINKDDDIFIGSEGGGGGGWSFYGGGGVFRSTNGGNSFDQVGLPISWVRNFVFSGDSLIFAATPSGVQKYNRITKKWKNLGLQQVEAVSITPSDYLYAATHVEGLYKSTDLGKSWFLTNLTIDTLMPVYNVLAVNDDTVFASTFYNLRRSTNGGENWSVLPIKTGEYTRGMFFNFYNNSLWLIGTESYKSTLYKTTDIGNTFINIYSVFNTYDSNNPITALDNGYVFLASRDQNLNGIARSTDIGSTWEQVLSLDNIKPTVYANNEGIVITGSVILNNSDTDKIYLSTNFGNTWENIVQPTHFGVSITQVRQDNSGKYFFGTSGQGLYEVDIITNVKNESSKKYNFYLSQNYPNPFNPSTNIRYSIPISGVVKLKVYNILGQEIKTLVNEYKHAGSYEIDFNGNNLPSGVYVYRLSSGNFSLSKKLLLLK